jgi:thiol-disulfide isomerase/thioredoxin
MNKIAITLILSTLTVGFISFNGLKSTQFPGKTFTGTPKVGDIAPELNFPSPNGSLIKLSSLHGKMVLIDFWAAWCKPCRYENPNVVKAYNNFKDKIFKDGNGFTIYSVSLDNLKQEWVAAIASDKLVWENHVSDLKGWQSEGAALYGVRAIPASFLIDGNGKILALNLRGEQLEKTLNKLLKQ